MVHYFTCETGSTAKPLISLYPSQKPGVRQLLHLNGLRGGFLLPMNHPPLGVVTPKIADAAHQPACGNLQAAMCGLENVKRIKVEKVQKEPGSSSWMSAGRFSIQPS